MSRVERPCADVVGQELQVQDGVAQGEDRSFLERLVEADGLPQPEPLQGGVALDGVVQLADQRPAAALVGALVVAGGGPADEVVVRDALRQALADRLEPAEAAPWTAPRTAGVELGSVKS